MLRRSPSPLRPEWIRKTGKAHCRVVLKFNVCKVWPSIIRTHSLSGTSLRLFTELLELRLHRHAPSSCLLSVECTSIDPCYSTPAGKMLSRGRVPNVHRPQGVYAQQASGLKSIGPKRHLSGWSLQSDSKSLRERSLMFHFMAQMSRFCFNQV